METEMQAIYRMSRELFFRLSIKEKLANMLHLSDKYDRIALPFSLKIKLLWLDIKIQLFRRH